MGATQEVAFMRDNEIFRRLEQVTSVASLTPEERRCYEADVKNARDALNQLRGAEERGLAKGLAKGREEEKIRMAREMLVNGLDPELIATISKLPLSEIFRL